MTVDDIKQWFRDNDFVIFENTESRIKIKKKGLYPRLRNNNAINFYFPQQTYIFMYIYIDNLI